MFGELEARGVRIDTGSHPIDKAQALSTRTA
jgi:hypothetical protein